MQATVDGVEHLEGADHGAGRRHIPLQAAARHLFDHLGELDGGQMQQVGGRPRALHFPHEPLLLRVSEARPAPEHRGEDEHGQREGDPRDDDVLLSSWAPPFEIDQVVGGC